MGKYTIHEEELKAVSLPGRDHKMIIGPENFGKSKKMCFGVADFPANQHAPGHVHEEQEEILYVLHGKGEMYFNNMPEKIEKGTCIFVPPKVVHSINNTSNEVLKVVYVFSPPVKQGSYDKK
jgi:mannose-6-phosphate isomerase-like protein (cupin superfamily)